MGLDELVELPVEPVPPDTTRDTPAGGQRAPAPACRSRSSMQPRTCLSASIQGGASRALRSMWNARPISPSRGSRSSTRGRPWPGRSSKSPRSWASRMSRSVSDSQVGAMEVTPSASRRIAGLRGGWTGWLMALRVRSSAHGATDRSERRCASVRLGPDLCRGSSAQQAAVATDVACGDPTGCVDIHDRRAAVGGAEQVTARGRTPKSSLGDRSLTERRRGIERTCEHPGDLPGTHAIRAGSPLCGCSPLDVEWERSGGLLVGVALRGS